jgi:hypothetical protein
MNPADDGPPELRELGRGELGNNEPGYFSDGEFSGRHTGWSAARAIR